MNPSWDHEDDASAYTMNSVDLLSISTSVDQGELGQRPLQDIVEESNHQETPALPPLQPTPPSAGVIYQIEFDAEHTGKHRPQSKRNISWKYGVPREAESGTKIGGHEAKLIWSTHSGKWAIFVDGEEVYSHQAKGSVLDYKWRWNHTKACVCDDEDEEGVPMRILACRKPPNRSSKDFRCYEFIVGGKIFRELPLLGSHSNNESRAGGEFQNEESTHDDGQLMSILDIVEPGWQSAGFA